MRMNTSKNHDPPTLLQKITHGISGIAEQVMLGLNWTAVVGPFGIGLSHSPARGTNGCFQVPSAGDYTGTKLINLAHLCQSKNIFEQAIGYAAINAHHNRLDLLGSDVNGLDLIEDSGEHSVVIRQFPGLANRIPNAAVIERDGRAGCYPSSATPELLATAKQVLITASALSNGTLEELLSLTNNAFVILVGPSAPLTPLLFDAGINAVSGFVAHNRESLLLSIMEGGTIAGIKRHGRYLTLTSD